MDEFNSLLRVLEGVQEGTWKGNREGAAGMHSIQTGNDRYTDHSLVESEFVGSLQIV
jgi:hypothetical protein